MLPRLAPHDRQRWSPASLCSQDPGTRNSCPGVLREHSLEGDPLMTQTLEPGAVAFSHRATFRGRGPDTTSRMFACRPPPGRSTSQWLLPSTFEGGCPIPSESLTNQRSALSGLRSFRTHRIFDFTNQACSTASVDGSTVGASMRWELAPVRPASTQMPVSDRRSMVSLDIVRSMSAPPRLPTLVVSAGLLPGFRCLHQWPSIRMTGWDKRSVNPG